MAEHLKILMLLETGGGGSGRHVIDLARGCLERGHVVHLIYSNIRIDPGFEESINDIPGLILKTIDMQRAPGLKDVAALVKLRRYIRQHGPFDIIHGHSSKAGALARLAVIGKHGASIYTPHAFRTLDPSLGALGRKVYIGIEFVLSHLTAALILVSTLELMHASAMGIDEKKLHVIPNGVDPRPADSRQSLRGEYGVAENDVCVGFVGRYVAQKAPDRMLKAYSLVVSRCPSVKLVMLGDGQMEGQLRILANDLGISDKVIWIKSEDGVSFMPMFDIFVMPSLYEGFPYVLLEAAVSGLALVATNVGGASEIITHGRNGYILESGDPDELAGLIEHLANDGELRASMGRASKDMGAEFSVSAMVDKTLALYNKVIAGDY